MLLFLVLYFMQLMLLFYHSSQGLTGKIWNIFFVVAIFVGLLSFLRFLMMVCKHPGYPFIIINYVCYFCYINCI